MKNTTSYGYGFKNGWSLQFNGDGNGYMSNYDKGLAFKFFVGYDFQFYGYQMDGSQCPMPKIPRYIKDEVVREEKKRRKDKASHWAYVG
jgi:hypothetical protein